MKKEKGRGRRRRHDEARLIGRRRKTIEGGQGKNLEIAVVTKIDISLEGYK